MFVPNINDILNSGVVAVINDAISWASANNGFFVAETPAGETVDAAITYAQGLTASSNAAVYYPHTYISDPIGRGSGAIRLIGPSAGVAGLYLATDASKSVAKAPAGLNSPLAGVISLERSFTSSELDNLNTGLPSSGTGSVAPVNAIRQLPGAGVVVMGARTLLQDGTANRYVNMRRSLIYIEQNLKNIAQIALFENNDERLWSRITSTFNSFLNDYRNQGGLRGATPAQSYYVLCNATNNTASSIQNGIVNIQVGVALEYPAEFVVINLSQMTLA
jgi:phage tail sheath protein FI